MARVRDHQRALELRKEGKSYNQIKKVLGISKSTLSYWLADHPLSKERIRELRDWNEQRIERYRETRRRTREARFEEVYQVQKKEILGLSRRDLLIGGLFLYWGEGTKARIGSLAMTNTDPAVARFFVYWLKTIFGIAKGSLKIKVHLYSDMDIKKELKFWSQELDIPTTQFLKPYIKATKKADISYRGGFGHGTCSVELNNSRLAEKVILGVKVIRDYFGVI